MEEIMAAERELKREEDGLEDEETTDGEVEYDECEEDYTLQFDGVEGPLRIIQEGEKWGIELYQLFERLEYEALAERKRSGLQQQSCEGEVQKPKKDEMLGVTMEEIEELMNFGSRKRTKQAKKRGRKKGIRNKLSPEVNTKIGDATLHYAAGSYKEAIPILEEAVQLAPNLQDSYYILGLIYDAMEDWKRAFNFTMIAAHLSPKDVSLWKKLIAWSTDHGNFGQARYCLTKAITADPKDIGLRFDRALLYAELGEYQKAADSYDQITSIYPANVEACMMAAKDFLQDLQMGSFEDHYELVNEVADTFLALGHYGYALKLYLIILGRTFDYKKATLNLKIGQCYFSSGERSKAIPFYYSALAKLEDDIDARITLSSLLIEEGREDEAISLLSPTICTNTPLDVSSTPPVSWWFSEKVKMQLAKIYRSKGMLEEFVDVIFSPVQKTLHVEAMTRRRRERKKRRLSKSVLSERVKLLENQHEDNVFGGFKPVVTSSELAKAIRAKRSLEKLIALREKKKAAALSVGMDWECEDSDGGAPNMIPDPPLPGLLKDEENHQLLLDLCKTLASLHRYAEALEIINCVTRLPSNKLSIEKKEVFQSLGAKIAYATADPKHAYDYARNLVEKHPYNMSAWNSYYEVILRFQNRFGKHLKFLHKMRVIHKDSVPPMVINGNQCTMQSMHQAAAEEYLLAYKLQPENPLINLCVGTALINLALGLRLHNKHQCVVQGFAFLYKYLRISNNNQEALYNVARACQHVGLVTLAALYYEKVLVVQEKDYPNRKLPNRVPGDLLTTKPGYCNLHMEAAFNLHLIYNKSGALDLSRDILKKFCTP